MRLYAPVPMKRRRAVQCREAGLNGASASARRVPRPGRTGHGGEPAVALADASLFHDEPDVCRRDQRGKIKPLCAGRGERAREPTQGEPHQPHRTSAGGERGADAELEHYLLEQGAQAREIERDELLAAPCPRACALHVMWKRDEPDVVAGNAKKVRVAADEIGATHLHGGTSSTVPRLFRNAGMARTYIRSPGACGRGDGADHKPSRGGESGSGGKVTKHPSGTRRREPARLRYESSGSPRYKRRERRLKRWTNPRDMPWNHGAAVTRLPQARWVPGGPPAPTPRTGDERPGDS